MMAAAQRGAASRSQPLPLLQLPLPANPLRWRGRPMALARVGRTFLPGCCRDAARSGVRGVSSDPPPCRSFTTRGRSPATSSSTSMALSTRLWTCGSALGMPPWQTTAQSGSRYVKWGRWAWRTATIFSTGGMLRTGTAGCGSQSRRRWRQARRRRRRGHRGGARLCAHSSREETSGPRGPRWSRGTSTGSSCGSTTLLRSNTMLWAASSRRSATSSHASAPRTRGIKGGSS
mmetsp:Transcript_5194/g.17217  ORF Transcript_5194/g.17217 Transcript_5194/m.17217 type:complete len:232 (+) Transcript_5194:583-1278(+)